MDLRRIELPGYYWRHYSSGNLYEIIHPVKKEGTTYIVDWLLFFSGEHNSVEVEIREKAYHFEIYDMRQHESVATLPDEEKRMIFKGIFHKLKVSFKL